MTRSRTLILHKRHQARRPRLGFVRLPQPAQQPAQPPRTGTNAA